MTLDPIVITQLAICAALYTVGYALHRRNTRKRREHLAQVERDNQWHT